MKIALVSDLHGQLRTLKYLEQIREKEKPDALILSGDITHAGETEFADSLFEIFDRYKEVYLICGNSDQGAAYKYLELSRYSINQRCHSLGSSKVCGLSFGEEVNSIDSDLSGSIFVTHQPPVQALMNKVYKYSPKFHISGHLHKSAFTKKYPSTIHIQVPTLQDGRYAILDLESAQVEFKVI